MATCQEVIRSAYRRGTIVAAGVNLNVTQMAIGLERLQDMYTKMVADGLFGRFIDKYLNSTDPYTAKEFERVFCAIAGTTVVLPSMESGLYPDPYDYGFVGNYGGMSEFPGPRQPFDGTPIVIVDPTNTDPTQITKMYLYDAMAGGWQALFGLTRNSYCPLTGQYKDGIINMLAVLLADEQPMAAPPVVTKMAAMARLSMASRYSSPRRPATIQDF